MLNKDSEKLLRMVSKTSVQSLWFMNAHREEYNELFDLGYVNHDKRDGFGLVTYESKLVITSKGKSYLRSVVVSQYRFWLATVISILALLISIAALLKP